MGSIVTGTCGYDYLDWRQTFYPAEVPREDWLSWYAGRFPAVELGSFFTRQPEASGVASLVRRAGEGLTFAVKAHGSLTHEVDPSDWRASARKFREGLAPLAASGQLGCLLFVFPKEFLHEAPRRRYLDELLGAFAGWPKAVEFRSPDWLTDRVLEGLRERATAWVGTDAPVLGGLSPVCDAVTAPLAYFRFHGRHEAGWWGSGASARYNYTYSTDELKALAARVRGLSAQVGKTFAFFNNHPSGQAARNAAEFLGLVGEVGDHG